MFCAPENVFFNILDFPIYYYGVILAVSIFLGIVVSNKVALKEYF